MAKSVFNHFDSAAFSFNFKHFKSLEKRERFLQSRRALAKEAEMRTMECLRSAPTRFPTTYFLAFLPSARPRSTPDQFGTRQC